MRNLCLLGVVLLSLYLSGCAGAVRKVVTMECVDNVCKYTERTSVTMSQEEGK